MTASSSETSVSVKSTAVVASITYTISIRGVLLLIYIFIYIIYNTAQKRFSFKEINTSILQGCIKIIRNASKDIYNGRKEWKNKCWYLDFVFNQRILKKCFAVLLFFNIHNNKKCLLTAMSNDC